MSFQVSTSWHLPTMLHHSLVPRLLSSFSAKYCALDQFIIVSHRLPPWIFCSTFCSTFCNTICYLHIISNVKWMRDSVMSLVMNVTLTQGSNRLPKTRYCYKYHNEYLPHKRYKLYKSAEHQQLIFNYKIWNTISMSQSSLVLIVYY